MVRQLILTQFGILFDLLFQFVVHVFLDGQNDLVHIKQPESPLQPSYLQENEQPPVLRVEPKELKRSQWNQFENKIIIQVVHRYLPQVANRHTLAIVGLVLDEKAQDHVEEEYEFEAEGQKDVLPAENQRVEVDVAGGEAAERNKYLLSLIQLAIVPNNAILEAIGEQVSLVKTVVVIVVEAIRGVFLVVLLLVTAILKQLEVLFDSLGVDFAELHLNDEVRRIYAKHFILLAYLLALRESNFQL